MVKKLHIVARIIRSNLEEFRELVGKLDDKDYKKIYNRCYRRLNARGIGKEKIKALINDEIIKEWVKILDL